MADEPFEDNEPQDDFEEEIEGAETKEELLLTDEQKSKILSMFNDKKKAPQISRIVEKVFKRGLDGRSKEARAIKKFIGTLGLKARTKTLPEKRITELTQAQKDFIANNIATMKEVELTETLFNKKVVGCPAELRAVTVYARSLNVPRRIDESKDNIYTEYKPPKSESAMILRLNKYIEPQIDVSKYDKDIKTQKWVKTCISYLNSFRFLQQINTYTKSSDRELFESSFLTYIWMKDDLEPEERDQYILLCTELVISKNILARIEKFQSMEDEIVDGDSIETKRLSMSLVESISNLRTEYNDSTKRQNQLLNDLKVKRSKKLENKIKETENLTTLVSFWKQEENRKQLLELANRRKKLLKDEVTRLTNLDDMKVQIWGIDPDELLNS